MVRAIDPIGYRLAGIEKEMTRRNVRAMLITNPLDVGYLSGFAGDDSWLLVGAGRPCLITDFRYEEQAAKECPQFARLIRKGSMAEALKKLIARRRIRSLGFDPDVLTVMEKSRLRLGLKSQLVPMAGAISALRIRKDASEVKAISKAIEAAEAGWLEFRKHIRLGMTEQRLAAELDHQMRLAGADGPAFPTICAIDASASMPHARPGGRRLKRGSILLTDFGALRGGYVCDLTRVLAFGKMSPRVRAVYDIVREAQAAGIAAVRPGAEFVEVDAAARQVIQAAGYNRHFQHGTGHGLGRQVHEPPSLGTRAGKGRLEPGMVVTIEPGIYLAGRFGIRIEDDVLVTDKGRRVLSHLERDPEAMVL
jgi:Xaa-Pro aminopeptidase